MALTDKPIYIMIDETIDKVSRYIVNVVVGALYIDRANHTTIAHVFTDALNILWPTRSQYEKVLLFVADGAV